jgi:hypothetical protein
MSRPEIPGAERVTAWFGYWPSFHDAEILSCHVNRDAASQIRVYTWRTAAELDASGRFVRDRETIVVFTLSKITWLRIEGEDINRQNVLGAISVEHKENGYRLVLGPSYGLSGEVTAADLEVSLESMSSIQPPPETSTP